MGATRKPLEKNGDNLSRPRNTYLYDFPQKTCYRTETTACISDGCVTSNDTLSQAPLES
jgi:hypothetical protein